MTQVDDFRRAFIDQPESRRLGFKESFPKGEQVARTAVAFVNGADGRIVFGVRNNPRPINQPESQPESLAAKALRELASGHLSKAEISATLGQKEISGQLNRVSQKLRKERLIEYTISAKPNGRLQKYRITIGGEKAIRNASES